MKKTFCIILTSIMLFLWSGCSKPQNFSTDTTTSPTTMTTQPTQTEPPTEPAQTELIVRQKPITAVCVPLHSVNHTTEDGTVLLNHSYQSISLLVQDPEVADKVIVDFLNRIDTTNTAAEQMKTTATNNYSASGNWIPYLCRLLYEPTRVDQSVLSLFGTYSTFSGGMHPDHINVSANYDLITGDVLTLGSIMHKDASMQLFSDLVIEELSKVAEKKYLFADFENAVKKRFTADESQDEAFYFSSRGLCFYFSPYEIAPYSSGTIIAEIPYEKLLGVLHDDYFPAERVYSDGTIQAVPFKEADLESILQISEAIITPGAEMYLLTADASIQNVRLCIGSDDPQGTEFVFFATSEINPGDGIMIEATSEELANIHVIYETSTGDNTFFPIF